MSGESQLQKQNDFQNKDILAILVTRAKKYIFQRNYLLTSRLNVTFLYAAILNIISFLQLYMIFSLPQYNDAVTQDSDIYFIVEKCVFLILKLNVKTELNINSMAIIALCAVQVLLLFSYTLPIKSKQLNSFLSKCFIQVFSTISYYPSIFIATQNIINSQSIYLSLLTILLALLNRLMFISMHFQFSIQGLTQNVLIRNPLSTTKEIVGFFFVILFLLCQEVLYPMSLLVYFVINIIFSLFEVKEYCIGFNYHHQSMPKLIGILKIMNISIFLCYLIVIATEITLVKNNILTFIMAFFVFFANFFLIFKKYATKSIVIDSDGDNQTKKIIFIMWYFNCFRNRAQKKNELYLSSLLKNHSSQCNDIQCCCKKRSQIYDPSKNLFGSPSSQPHQDIVYIKHFFLKQLTQTYKQYHKSTEILFLLAFYNLQILHFIPQTIQLIKQLKRKSLKQNLTFSEDYVLHCLAQRCYSRINQINNDKGNLDLQKVRMFDLKILELKQTIKFSVDQFSRLWKTICYQKYNQKNLVQICKVALEVMFKIQETYKQIKTINSVSSQLKQLMILYSKSVAHDIHLLSEVRKEIRLNSQKMITSNLTQIKDINIFSPDTITLITSEVSNIRWASKNCYSIFGYSSRQEFLKLKINDLMPKYFSENHDNYINKWLETGHSTKLNKSSYLWGSTKQGYCFSLALYIKIIPLEKQQDFAFFAAIQKIDIDNQIICNQEGEILGCGKFFSSTIKCSQKSFQDYKPNIQILIPSTFELFLEHFYPEKKSSHQIMGEGKRQGYFPKNLESVLKDVFKEKQAFLNKNIRKSNLKELLCNFLKEKMQEVTVYMDGQYISFISTVHQLPVLQNKKKKIIVFKLSGFKKNNVEKYYSQLEKMISKIETLKKQNRNLKKKKSMKYQSSKSVKKDYFKVFLNPKRVKKILQQEGQQRQAQQTQEPQRFSRLDAISNENRQKMQSQRKRTQKDSCIVDQQKIIGYRKKLALNAQFQIKGERAKYNIWRMKKVLFEEGIFSRYTYNMLVGEGNNFESIRQINRTNDKIEDPFITGPHYQEDINCSDDELTSDNLTNRAEAQNLDKGPNDKETFNSATSSAAFISMTNSIKMFKMKLRSLNTPKLLYWLNVGLIVLVLLVASFGVWLWMVQVTSTDLGQIYFTKGVQSTWVIDALLMGKLLTQKINQMARFSSSFSPANYTAILNRLTQMRTIYTNFLHEILSVQLFQFAQLQKRDPQLLQYLFLNIPLNQTIKQNSQIKFLSSLEFMMRQEDYSKLGFNVRNQIQIESLLNKHRNVYENNIYYTSLNQVDTSLFFGSFTAFLIALIITIPIVYKIQWKVEEIMYLISKISVNQRKRYYLQFTVLSQELQKLLQTESWQEIQTIQQNRLHSMSLKSTITSQFSQENTADKDSGSIKSKQKQVKTHFYSTIYFKIIVIYMVYLAVYCTKFIYIKIQFQNFLTQNQIFTKMLTQKLKLTQDSLQFNQYLTDQNIPDSLNVGSTQLIDKIYDSYHLNQADESDYDGFIQNLTVSNICKSIRQRIGSEGSYLSFFLYKSQSQVQQCSNLKNGSLTKGLFTTYDYIQQKRSDIISKSYDQRVKFLKTEELIDLEKMLYYSNTMTYIIQNELRFQVQQKKDSIVFQMSIWLIIVAAFLIIFTVSWIFIYLNIAERASYINAFLLLIPYEVLSENPYIKLYIKNEFDYKSSVY